MCTVCDDGILVKDGKCEDINKCTIVDCTHCTTKKDVEYCVTCKMGKSIFP